MATPCDTCNPCHCCHPHYPYHFPHLDGDILIHTGDFCYRWGNTAEFADFDAFLARQPHAHKLVVLGNHDLGTEVRRLLPGVRDQERGGPLKQGGGAGGSSPFPDPPPTYSLRMAQS